MKVADIPEKKTNRPDRSNHCMDQYKACPTQKAVSRPKQIRCESDIHPIPYNVGTSEQLAYHAKYPLALSSPS